MRTTAVCTAMARTKARNAGDFRGKQVLIKKNKTNTDSDLY